LVKGGGDAIEKASQLLDLAFRKYALDAGIDGREGFPRRLKRGLVRIPTERMASAPWLKTLLGWSGREAFLSGNARRVFKL